CGALRRATAGVAVPHVRLPGPVAVPARPDEACDRGPGHASDVAGPGWRYPGWPAGEGVGRAAAAVRGMRGVRALSDGVGAHGAQQDHHALRLPSAGAVACRDGMACKLDWNGGQLSPRIRDAATPDDRGKGPR